MTQHANRSALSHTKTHPARLLAPIMLPFRRQNTLIHIIIVLQALSLLPLHFALAFICASWLAASNVPNAVLAIVPTCMMIRLLLQLMKEHLATGLSLRVRQHVRQQLQQRLQQYGPARRWYGSDSEHAMILEKVDALDGYLSRYLPQQKLAVIAPLVIALSVGYFSPLAAVLLVITAPILIVFMILTGLHATKANNAHLQQLTLLGGRLLDFLQGRSTLQQLNAVTIAEDILAQSSQAYLRKTMNVLKMAFLSTAVLELFASLAVALVALYLGLGLLGELPWAQHLQVLPYQAALFILLLAPEFYLPLRQLGNDYHAKAQAISALEQLSPLWQDAAKVAMMTPPRFDKPAKPLTSSAASTRRDAPLIQIHQLKIPQAPELYIANWQLFAGEHWLITGASGLGKSSLLQALCGFLPIEGELLFDESVVKAPQSWQCWRENISYLPQQVVLAYGTVRQNLSWVSGVSDEEQLQNALRQVELANVLSLDDRLGADGIALSGGQQQRLALAQLLLQDRAIWLLDEPLVQLDDRAAQALSALLARLAVGRTLLVVSHQPWVLPWITQQLRLESHMAFTEHATQELS